MRAPAHRARRTVSSSILSIASATFFLSGCVLVRSSQRDYLSNQTALEAVAKAVGYQVDPARYQLVAVEVHEDLITLQYRGVEKVGDSAWVVRFSEKSTEQNPEAISDIYSLIPLLEEGRKGFVVVEDGERKVAGTVARFVRYRFDSPVSGEDGKPFAAHGIVVTLRRTEEGVAVVYQIKLDNHGDRDDVTWDDLAPFFEPLSRG